MRATILVFAGLQALDVATTAVGLGQGLPELNPTASAIIGAWGFPALVGLKLALSLAVAVYLLRVPPRAARFAVPAVQAMSVGMAFVVVSNVGVAAG